MRYFFDTEFNENVHPIELISLGVVSTAGKELYVVHKDYSKSPQYLSPNGGPLEDYPHLHSCNDWVKKNVLPVLFSPEGANAGSGYIGNDEDIRSLLVEYIADDPHTEFWAYFGSYDWFLLTSLWKGFDKMPKNWPRIYYDLYQFAKHNGSNKTLPQRFKPEHNALVDARWTRKSFDYCIAQRAGGEVWP